MDIKKKIANLTRGEIELLEGAIFYTPEEIKFGWYYLQIKGDSYKRGFQHGFFLGSEIRDHIDRNFRALWFMTGNESSFYCEAARRLWLDKIDDEFLTELQGIVDGTACRGRLENKEIAVTLPEILAWNGLYELFMSWLPLESISTSKNFIPRKNQKSCTAFIATGEATKGHHTVMAHTTWDAYHIEAPHKLILDIFPEKGHHILMQGCFGHIDSFSDFFLTGTGIMGTETTIAGGFLGYNENGAPGFYRARKAMQYAESIDHWVSIMSNQNSGGVANSWLLGTSYSNEIVRFELGFKFQNVERKYNGAFFGFNAATDPKIRNQECAFPAIYYDIRDCGGRRIRLMQLIGNLDKPMEMAIKEEDKNGKYYGKIDINHSMKILGDHLDVYRQQQPHKYTKVQLENPCGRTICGHFEKDPEVPSFHTNIPSFYPCGSVDGKVVDADMASHMTFVARSGHPCGENFDAAQFLEKHPQYDWLEGILESMPAYPWALCRTPKKEGESPIIKYNMS